MKNGQCLLGRSLASRASAAIALAIFSTLACAHGKPATPEAPMPLRPQYRSSVQAVLAHRTELALTDEQVRQLEAIDDQLQSDNANLRVSGSSGAARQPQGAGMGSGRGGRMGGGRGMGRGYGGHHHGDSADEGSRRREALREQRDENDTQAFLEAEKQLTEQQRPPAQEFAEQYREQLFAWREARRQRGGDAPEGERQKPQ